MRIAIVSAINQTPFINEFIKNWPKYKKVSLKPVLDDTVESYVRYFNDLIDDTIKYKKDDCIVHEYSVIDGLCNIFMLGAYDKIQSDVINTCVLLARNAIHFYDLVLYLPLLKNEAVIESIKEIDNFLSAIHQDYAQGKEMLFEFSSPDGAPALVEVFGNLQEKLQICKLYINEEGKPFGSKPEDSLLQLPSVEEQVYIDKIIEQNKK
jgi:hypothetical protein